MGLITAALGAAGDEANRVIDQQTKQQNAIDLQTNQASLTLANEQAMLKAKQDIADSVRQAQAGRINSAAQGIVGQQIASQYQSSNDAVAAANAGQTDAPMTDAQMAAIQQSKDLAAQALVNDPKVLAKAATSTGDYATAQELTKIADAGKVSAGYGAKVIDQNDIDPATNLPRVLIDNAQDRTEVGRANADARQSGADARQTQADAAMVRAKAIADATGSKDPVLQSLGTAAQNARIELDRLRGLDAQNPPRRGESSAYAPLIDKAQQAYDAATATLLARQQAHLANTPVKSSTAGSGDPTAADVSGPMGTTLKIIDENIKAIEDGIKKTPDPQSKLDLQGQLADYQAQRTRLVTPAAPASAAAKAVPSVAVGQIYRGPDGAYPYNGKTVVVKGGVITEVR